MEALWQGITRRRCSSLEQKEGCVQLTVSGQGQPMGLQEKLRGGQGGPHRIRDGLQTPEPGEDLGEGVGWRLGRDQGY